MSSMTHRLVLLSALMLGAACGAPAADVRAPDGAGAPGAPRAATSPAGPPARSRIRERLAPCHVDGATEPLLCGSYPVWENRTTRRGRKIDLRVVVVPALGPDVAPDPVVVFAGGPGDTATGGAAGWAGDHELRAHRDIVLVDQRGTGGSHRLDCRVPRDPHDVQAYFEPSLPAAEVERCRAELAQNSDLAQYTTSIAADDLDEVRAWLGYDQLNLNGSSYGTRAAQVYLHRHGDHVRTVTLVGVSSPEQYLPLFHALDGQHALDLVLAACQREPACATAFPAIAAEHARVLAGLDRARGHATVQSPVDHQPVAITIPRAIFAEQLRFALYNPATAAVVPYIIDRAAHGDFEPFARLAMMWEPAFRQVIAYGMHLSVTCAEDVPFITEDAITRAIAGTYLQGYRVRQQVAACQRWPRGEIPADFHALVRSNVPVLMISGPYDPVTPPRWAEQVATGFPHGRHVIVPEAHHGAGGLSHPECVAGLTTAFLERGTADGLDASCVTGMARPPFVTDEAGFTALLALFGDG